MSEVLVVARARIKPEQRAAFLAAAHDLALVSRADPGCIEYSFYEDITEPGRFITVERWVDWDSGQAHFASPHSQAMLAAAPDFVCEPPTITVYPAAPAQRIV